MYRAYVAAAVGTRADIEDGVSGSVGAPRDLLRAILAQFRGDIDGTVRMIKHQLWRVTNSDRAYLADTLAPILIMRHENTSVLELAAILEAAGWDACAASYRSLVAADEGDNIGARYFFTKSARGLEDIEDDFIRARVTQRLARAAFYIGDYEKALDLTFQAVSIAKPVGCWRVTAAAYSVAYNVHHNVTGDVWEADRFARLWLESALTLGDESFIQSALVAEYELAAHFADDERISKLERLITSRLLPQQYRERFPLAFAHAMVRGRQDLIAMRTLLQVLRDTNDRSRGEWALCTAAIALADASASEDANARLMLRQAVERLGRPRSRDPAYERRYRRLARAIISACCVMLGDHVRADRVVGTQEARQGERIDNVPALVRQQAWSEFDASLRGLAALMKRAVVGRQGEMAPAGLTSAEFEVLRLLGNGWSAGRIAKATDRSVNTVYNHTRSILSKLDATRAAEAVAIARKRGLLA